MLGIVGCNNRNTAIYELVLSETVVEGGGSVEGEKEGIAEERKWVALESHRLSQVGRSARSPRVLLGKDGKLE